MVGLSKRAKVGVDCLASLAVHEVRPEPKFFVTETAKTVSMSYEWEVTTPRKYTSTGKVFTMVINGDPKKRALFDKLFQIAVWEYQARLKYYKANPEAA